MSIWYCHKCKKTFGSTMICPSCYVAGSRVEFSPSTPSPMNTIPPIPPTPPPQAPDDTALVIARLSDANVRIYAHLWGDGKGDRITVQQYTDIMHSLSTAIPHLAALQARCARLEEDGKDLDWLEKNLTHLNNFNRKKTKAWAANPSMNYEYDTFSTLRKAIRAARTTKEAT